MSAILVVGPAWVGDMVMAQSLFMTLKRQSPESEIDVLAPAWSEPLIARMPEVRRSVVMPLGHGRFGLGQRYRLGRTLRGAGYQRAVVLPRSFKSALVPFFAQVPVRTGYRGEMRYGLLNDIRPLDKRVLTRTVQRYVALGLPADAPLPPQTPYSRLRVDADNQARLLAPLGLSLDRPAIGFMPGAEYGIAKRWPPEHFAELARRLWLAGYQVWQFGSEKDRGVAEAINGMAGGITRNLCGKTALADAVDLIAATTAVVTNDSGLMHVAAAVGRPVVAVYGSSSPFYTPPLSDRAEVLYLGLECSPCFERSCPKGHTRCLADIAPEAALAALERLGILESQ